MWTIQLTWGSVGAWNVKVPEGIISHPWSGFVGNWRGWCVVIGVGARYVVSCQLWGVNDDSLTVVRVWKIKSWTILINLHFINWVLELFARFVEHGMSINVFPDQLFLFSVHPVACHLYSVWQVAAWLCARGIMYPQAEEWLTECVDDRR